VILQQVETTQFLYNKIYHIHNVNTIIQVIIKVHHQVDHIRTVHNQLSIPKLQSQRSIQNLLNQTPIVLKVHNHSMNIIKVRDLIQNMPKVYNVLPNVQKIRHRVHNNHKAQSQVLDKHNIIISHGQFHKHSFVGNATQADKR
jgi:hypothetical protein